MPFTNSILYLTEQDVHQTLSVAECIQLAEKGIKADAAHEVVGDKFYTQIGESGFVKPFTGYLAGEDYFFVKTFSFFPSNPVNFGQPTTTSLVLLFDAETGLPVCIMEAGYVTGLKTSASSAVTAKTLARSDTKNVAIFGAGLQGRLHARALKEVFNLEQIWLLDIVPEVGERAAAELRMDWGLPVEAVPLADRQAVVSQADMVFTLTTGDMVLVEYGWLRPGTFLARLGSFTEVSTRVITRADKVVVDNWHYVHGRIPELITLEKAGLFAEKDLHAEWPEIVGGRKPGRESSEEIIVYIALGIWGEYAAILPEVYRRAVSMGLGTRLPNSQVVTGRVVDGMPSVDEI